MSKFKGLLSLSILTLCFSLASQASTTFDSRNVANDADQSVTVQLVDQHEEEQAADVDDGVNAEDQMQHDQDMPSDESATDDAQSASTGDADNPDEQNTYDDAM